MRLSRGLTILESLTVVAVVSVLVSILVPVLSRAKRGAQIQDSISRMRQLYVAVEQYRTDYDGIDGSYESATTDTLGLPPNFDSFPKVPDSLWVSPCGFDDAIRHTGLGQFPGNIAYVPPYYAPAMIERPELANCKWYANYIARYKQNSALFIDGYCNDPGTMMNNPFSAKRGLAVLLSGQVVNRIRAGDASRLEFYSDQP